MYEILRKLSKFGLQYCDLETMIRNVDVMLRFLAINIDVRNQKPSLIYHVVALYMVAVYFYVYIFSVAWQALTKTTLDWVTKIVLYSLTFSSIISMIKVLFIYLNHDTIQKVVSEYLTCNSKVKPSSRFGRNLNISLRIVKKRALIYWCIIICNTSIYTILPFFKTGRHIPDDNLIIYGLEPMFESPNYEIAVFLNATAMFAVGYMPAHIGYFFIFICGYVEAYMLALSKELEGLWQDSLEFYEENKDKINNKSNNTQKNNQEEVIAKFIENQLVSIAHRHVIAINLIKKVQEVYQRSLATGLIFLMISLILDLLGGLENTGLQMPYSLLMVFMDCLSGQRIMDASLTFERAVYDCNWENFDPSNRKKVLLLLMNSQKTMQLAAGSVTTLGFETFGKVIKTIYSAFTAIQSTVNT